MEPLRLNKALASAGVCSRRAADDLIAAGRISVNGLTVFEMGRKVTPGIDTIAVDGKNISFEAHNAARTYLMLHKPIQVVCTVKDPEGRPTVLNLLPESHAHKRLYPVGRLDFFSEGLLILTDDGELTHRLTHPRYHLDKVYAVRLREVPTESALRAMRNGMRLTEGDKLAPVEVKQHGDGATLLLTLRQGVNRQIRRMCRDLGLTILTLRRIRTGPVSLGDLPLGKCRSLTQDEIRALRRAVGLV